MTVYRTDDEIDVSELLDRIDDVKRQLDYATVNGYPTLIELLTARLAKLEAWWQQECDAAKRDTGY